HVVFDLGELVRYVRFRERLHATRPRIGHLQLTSPHFRSRERPTVRDLSRAFRRLDRASLDDNPFLILEEDGPGADRVAFIQTMREADGYRVEVRDGSTKKQFFRGRNASRDEALALFKAFLRQGTAVVDSTWADITAQVAREIGAARQEHGEGEGQA